MSAKIVTLYSVPPYNKFFSTEFRFKDKEKFLVEKDDGKFYHLQSIKTKRKVVLSKEYFVKSEEKVSDKKEKIKWDE